VLRLRPARRGRDGREAGDHLTEALHGSQLALHAAAASEAKGVVAEEEALPALFPAEQLDVEAHAARYTRTGINFSGVAAAVRLEVLWMEYFGRIRRGEGTRLHGGGGTLSVSQNYLISPHYGPDQSYTDDAVNLLVLAEHAMEKQEIEHRHKVRKTLSPPTS
jgi:hypothetical protein